MLPPTSKRQYIAAYNDFKQWRSKKKITSFSEDVIFIYFNEISSKYAASTLWAQYSMLRATISALDSIYISAYKKVLAFLNHQNATHQQKKSKDFTIEQVKNFVGQAPNEKY